MRIVVLGAGVIGVTSAYALARDGHDVVVVEKEKGAAEGTSFANGGLVHVSLVEPWNAPGVALKALGWLGEDKPALIRTRALPGLMRWGLGFLRNSTSARHRQHTMTNLKLAVHSSASLKQIRSAEGIEYDHGEGGLLQLFRSPAALEDARDTARLFERHGVRHKTLDRAGLIALEPALEPIGDQLEGAMLYPDDESGDCGRFTRALAAVAAERYGVEFRFRAEAVRFEVQGARVVGLHTRQDRLEADAYVLALGTRSAWVGRTAGLDLPIYPVKGYSLTLDLGGWNAAPKMPVTDEALKIGLVPLGQRLRVAGSAEFTGFDPEPDPRRVRYIFESAKKIYPALDGQVDPDALNAWSGLRPMTTDGPPVLGATPLENLFLNTGHGHLGWTMAAGSADLLAAVVGRRTPPVDLDGLTYARFRR